MIMLIKIIKKSQVVQSFSIFRLLSKSNRRYCLITVSFSLLNGIFELLSLLLISAFISSISSFSKSSTLSIKSDYSFEVKKLALTLSFTQAIYLLIFIFIFSYTAKFLSISFASKASARSGNSISSDLFKLFFTQDYLSILATNSNILAANTLSHISGLITIINFQIQLISSAVLSLFIIIAIFSLYPAQSFFISLIAASIYSAYYLFFRSKFRACSETIARNNESLFKILQEAKSSSRELITNNSMQHSYSQFQSFDFSKRLAEAELGVIATMPKIFIEFTVFVVFVLSVAFVVSRSEPASIFLALSSIVTLLIAFQKLLPSFQAIFSAVAGINGSFSSLKTVLNFKYQLLSHQAYLNDGDSSSTFLEPNIKLSGIKFCYPLKSNPVIKNLDLSIPYGTKIGIVGPSGSGKSTFLNILLGLIKPQEGCVYINNLPLINNNISKSLHYSFWKDISVVSQSIQLFDESILYNITHEKSCSRIYSPFLKEILHFCRIDDFIMDLPSGLDFNVGQSGGNLSGGQIQRIGIARALYKLPKVLILDEPTSALDANLSESILAYIYSLDITVIFVSHKLSDLDRCSAFVHL